MLNELLPFPYSQFSVGMDRALNQLETISNTNTAKYPPYNIVSKGEDNYSIEIALAGFSKEDIEVEYFDSVVSVKSKETKKDDAEYLHKGISHRKFSKDFKLSDDIEIKSVTMENGMLFINLERVVPENKKRRLININ